MPPIISIKDRDELVETSQYPHAKWPFASFNPVQSRVFEYYDQEVNGLIAAATSAGKTVVAELFGAHEVGKRGGSFLYLCPLRALAQEKIDDWTSDRHHFHGRKIAICTGDYRLTPDRKKELEEAEVIIMTSEMLNHRARNHKSEQNNWLVNVGTLVVDESHLLTVPGRGDHLEVGLMKFTEINPQARLVLLSATMPNVEEIAEWVSYVLTKRNTFVLRSDYRPCPLSVHYEKYDVGSSYAENEQAKVDYALDIVDYYPDDKFLIFSHTIDTGHLMTNALKKGGVKAEFHYSGLEKDKRLALERRFKEEADFRVVVATSTLAWGLNLPARRVIVLGVHRGMNEVATYDIAQMVGRAGRPAFDPAGDAYVLLPERNYDVYKSRLRKSEPIRSQLLEEVGGKNKLLAFHLVSEIHHGDVKTKEDVHHWYGRSLANFQSQELRDDTVDRTLELLEKCFAIAYDEEKGEYKATSIGMISSMFYFSPFDVSDLRFNFKNLFEGNFQNDDVRVAMALANLDTHRAGIVSRNDREEIGSFHAKVAPLYGGRVSEAAVKIGFAYHCLLNGHTSQPLASTMRNLQFDFPRLGQVLYALDSMSGRWGKQGWLAALQRRVAYGVKAELTDIVQLPGVGKVRAQRLWDANLRSIQDIADNPDKVRLATGLSKDKAAEVVEGAKKLLIQ